MDSGQLIKFNEVWHKWEPTPKITGNYKIGDFGFTADGFKVIVEHRESKQTVEVLFEGSIQAFRSTDEGRRLKLGYDLRAKYGADFLRYWSFFKVERSEYLEWISEQSYEISDFLEVKHFVIIDSEEILEIIFTKLMYSLKVIIIKTLLEKIIYTLVVMGATGLIVYLYNK